MAQGLVTISTGEPLSTVSIWASPDSVLSELSRGMSRLVWPVH